MSLTSDTNWRIRTDGSDTLVGGGFDPSFGDGTDATDAASPAVAVTDGVTNGTTTVTSATANFQSGHKRNILRITGDGYYRVDTVNSTTQVTVDRATANGGSGRTMHLGGAFASPRPLCTTCTAGAPPITSPLAPGHIVNVQGSGTETPGSATYSWSTDYVFPDGAPTSLPDGGYVKWLSTSGKVRVDLTGAFANSNGHLWKDFYWVSTGVGGDPYMMTSRTDGSGITGWLYDCVFDQNGYGIGGTIFTNVIGCGFINSGTGPNTQANAVAAVAGIGGEPNGTNYGRIMGNSFVGWIVDAAGGVISHPNYLTIEGNLLVNCTAGRGIDTATAAGNSSIIGNTFHNIANGIKLYHFPIQASYLIRNNLFASIAGVAIDFSTVDATYTPSRYNLMPDYNGFYNCGTKYGTNVTAGPHDKSCTADPFMSAAALDFRLNNVTNGGAVLRGQGWPTSYFGIN